jgi:hypothetical protein
VAGGEFRTVVVAGGESLKLLWLLAVCEAANQFLVVADGECQLTLPNLWLNWKRRPVLGYGNGPRL